jgi:hypothetical protein
MGGEIKDVRDAEKEIKKSVDGNKIDESEVKSTDNAYNFLKEKSGETSTDIAKQEIKKAADKVLEKYTADIQT